MSFSLREYLKADYKANKGNLKGLFLVIHFRIANWLRTKNKSSFILGIPYLIWYKFYIEWTMGFELPCSTQVGKGLLVHHGNGIVINPKTIIGADCCLLHQVTIGTIGDGETAETPVIGDGVIIGVGAKILGDVTVGDKARIGASSLVLKSIPPGMVAVGNPMRILSNKS